ncbi:unnamed protein product [Coregonus sp. 'balchen']|nr:unnamed protein product [Coregonus sp. 'balchen']
MQRWFQGVYKTMCSQQVRVRLLPSPRCFFDEQVHVQVDGLSPHQKVELRSKLRDDKGVIFRASALYEADAAGQVDLCRSPSLGGSYTGVEPMGLFWTMAPETPHSKMLKKNVLDSMMVNIDVLHGDTGELLVTETNERRFMTEGVRRIPLDLKEGRIRGVLFLPPGKGPFPGVLDVYTLGGGLSEVRASLLANKGFVVLALAYYGYQDLSRTVPKHFDLEYFEEAITFLRRQPQVQGPGIGILSISKSGDLALSMASFLSGISATACINSSNANIMTPLHYKDLIIPPLMPVLENVTLLPSGLLDVRDAIPDPETEGNRGRQELEQLVSSPSRAAARLRNHGKDNFEVVTYPRAGHFLEWWCMGERLKAHHEAQLDLWRRVQEFFRKHLKDSSNTVQDARL